MDYQLAVVFSKSRKFTIGSWVIRTVSGKPYSHVSLRFTKGGDKFYLEAARGYNQVTPEKKWHKKNKIIKYHRLPNLDIEPASFDKYVSEETDDEKYGYLRVLGIGIARLFNMGRNIWPQRQARICSETVIRAMAEFYKVELPEKIELYEPKDVDEFLGFFLKAPLK